VAEQLLCRHSGFLEPFRPRPIDQPIGATTPPPSVQRHVRSQGLEAPGVSGLGASSLPIRLLGTFAYVWPRRGRASANSPAPPLKSIKMGVSVDDRAFYERRLREELARSTTDATPTVIRLD
jgi:hypothetical protein